MGKRDSHTGKPLGGFDKGWTGNLEFQQEGMVECPSILVLSRHCKGADHGGFHSELIPFSLLEERWVGTQGFRGSRAQRAEKGKAEWLFAIEAGMCGEGCSSGLDPKQREWAGSRVWI
jgi:hypothetical protein